MDSRLVSIDTDDICLYLPLYVTNSVYNASIYVNLPKVASRIERECESSSPEIMRISSLLVLASIGVAEAARGGFEPQQHGGFFGKRFQVKST